MRPVHHRREDRVRAHLFLCMLAYSVQRRMERALAPLLFRDEAPPERVDPVAPADRSVAAQRKDQTKLTADGFPVHSFRTLLMELARIVKNRVRLHHAAAFEATTTPTAMQAYAFRLLGLGPSAL